MITLQLMTDSEVNDFLATTWIDYRISLLSAGFSDEQADENIARNKSVLLVDGRPTPDQHFLHVLHLADRVGTLWVASREHESPGHWFIYDIVIAEQYRGCGYGRGAMEAVETYVRKHGGNSVGLNVFGFNTVARSLYESLGYITQNIGMKKNLVGKS